MNEDTYNKYIVTLYKDSNVEDFKAKMEKNNIRVKSQLTLAPVFVILTNDESYKSLRTWPEVKRIEDEFRFRSLAPPSS